jgi:hypothetical protein
MDFFKLFFMKKGREPQKRRKQEQDWGEIH